MSLSPQREKFAVELAKGATQTDAYRIAYPTSLKWQDKTLWSKASEMAAKPAVRARVQALLAPTLKRHEVSVERVLAERARMAFIDVADLVDENGVPVPLHKLPRDVTKGIAGVKWDKDGGVEFKLDKSGGLGALERHLGMYADDAANRRAGFLNITIVLT